MTKFFMIFRHLYVQVLVAIMVGVMLGHFAPNWGVEMKPLGDGFIKLIKMVIPPIIFCTVIHGITGMENLRQVGKVGAKALLYFMGMTGFALSISLVIVNVYRPGEGMNVDVATLNTESIAHYTNGVAHGEGVVAFLLGIIPATVSSAFVEGNILQILFLAILVAVALVQMGEIGAPIVKAIEQISKLLFGIIRLIMKLAPIGVFGAMAFTIGQYGLEALAPLLRLMIGFYVTCVLFIALVLGAVMRMCGFSLWKFLKYIREEIFIVIGTSSSESVLPRMIEKMTELGCKRSIAGMVIPTGYSFNLDGTAIYLSMAAIFIAQATNTPVSLVQELGLLAVLLITSKGAAGVTGSGFVVLASTLATVGHIPVAGIALILGIDRFMSEARAVTNLIGNGVATIVIARWEGAMDVGKAGEVI